MAGIGTASAMWLIMMEPVRVSLTLDMSSRDVPGTHNAMYMSADATECISIASRYHETT